ncbi:MAG: sigma-70 family RNA polymerase sigma factor [Frankiaceae bacterium]|nr:sigma-70 family RNA polymerase sigma factor [Frankiaceae bacterium]
MIETPEFDDVWTEMRDRLARVLAARGVPAQDRDDLLQETALRLYRVWGTLDPTQPVWPYAVTIALNLWRDSLRSAATHVREVAPVLEYDNADDLDVERTVIARQELASVSAALRALAPEQRRLVLETDELTSVVRPLRAAERMSRMRVRRELARVVGRASAVAALIFLRRQHRAQAMVAAAFTGALAATVFSGSPAVSMTTAMPPTPIVAAPVAAPVAATHAIASRPVAKVIAQRPARVARVVARKHAAVVRRVCAPASAPQGVSGPTSDPTTTTNPQPPAGSGPGVDTVVTAAQTLTGRPVAQVKMPTAHATNDGCVEVVGG